jgi:hypothetical protein
MVELNNQELMNIDGGDFMSVAAEVIQTTQDVIKTGTEVFTTGADVYSLLSSMTSGFSFL